MLTRRTTLAGLAASTAALACSGAPAHSQNFTKQVHIIVPYGPGGTSDYHVTADGRQFVINTIVGYPQVPAIQVMVNWTGPMSR